MNVILLTNDEEFIKFLDPEQMEILEVEEQYKISTLTISYPLTEEIKSDLKHFQPGNKIFITKAQTCKDCLYVINEQVSVDLWEKNKINITVEEIITELNNTPLITMADIPTVSFEIVPQSDSKKWITEFFGNWFNIGRCDPGLTNNRISLNGSINRMELLRYLEQETGNIFVTEYKKLSEDDEGFNPDNPNVIKRILHFLQPQRVGSVKSVIDLGYNADNIIYDENEADCYSAIAPVMDWNETEITRSKFITLINNFKNLEIIKGDQIPMILTEAISAKLHPLSNEGQFGANYWRRTPDSETYSYYSGLLKYGGTVTAANSKTIMGTANATTNNKGKIYSCNADGTYYYWDGSSQRSMVCKSGDQWLSNGTSWGRYSNESNWTAHSVKYVQAEAVWSAPFTKHKGEFYVSDNNEDSKIKYQNIYSRPDYDSQLNGEYEIGETTSETVETGTGIEEQNTNTHHNTPKIGTIQSNDKNEILLYNDCAMALKEHKYPVLNLDVDVKDLNQDSYNIFDTVHIKREGLDSLITATVVKTEKNPHLVGENKITLSSAECNGRVNLATPHFELMDSLQKSNNPFTFTGKLLESVTHEEVIDGETVLILEENPVVNKLVSIAVIKPDTQITTHTTTVKKTTINKKSFWSKYGVSPDKSKVCGIGYVSTGADTHKWGVDYKGIFKNKCPNCNRTGGLRWNRGKRAKSQAKQDGEFTCKYCDSDYSIEGNEKGSTHTKLSKISLTKSNKTDSSKLLSGKLVYSNTTTKTTTSPNSTQTTTQQSSGWTKLYTAITNSDGEFSVNLKLEGIEEKDYLIKCVFGGDNFYNTCSDECTLTVPSDEIYKTVYENQKSSTSHTPIKRGSNNSKCTNLKRQSGVVSQTIINKAKKIVGKKTGLAAVRACAEYVSNLKQVDQQNFCQAPKKTLSSGKGNCCCKTDLFLQLLEGADLLVGQGGNIIAKYVHVPTGKGHVFALIRTQNESTGRYVDVSHKNCWGSVCKGYYPNNNSKTSSYPCLPFERSY